MTSERQRVVVIGGGLAGLRLAARLGADTDAGAEVTVLGEPSTVGALARGRQDAGTLTDLFHLLTDDGGS
ncbi:hypothetical protein EDE04_4636 [Streptomyces sp. 2132.2]|uniref:NAD(P)-binding protein n=1 Tax=Streptomyces sp. 2132.2 TaxID=2485161 RepID=UPI000C195AEC|nr:NAD(P)-binding protein [Streptomyces sp. 2132.2]ROQ98113.1 hypothetical protein EDE04_4636 [Streptomyces sp. 2132.2]